MKKDGIKQKKISTPEEIKARRKARANKKPNRPVIRIDAKTKKASTNQVDTGAGGENGSVGANEYNFDRVMAEQEKRKKEENQKVSNVTKSSVKKTEPKVTKVISEENTSVGSPIEKRIYSLKALQKKVQFLRLVSQFASTIPEDSDFPEVNKEVNQLVNSFIEKVVKKLEDSII